MLKPDMEVTTAREHAPFSRATDGPPALSGSSFGWACAAYAVRAQLRTDAGPVRPRRVARTPRCCL
jgi:hypothetical protein